MKLLFVALCMAVVVSQVYSLKCYECAGPVDGKDACNDPAKNKVTETECVLDGLVCGTSVVKTNDVKVVTRQCQETGTCKALKDTGVDVVKCETCKTDLCNKQTNLSGSGAAVLPPLILIGCFAIFASLFSYH